MKNIQIPDDTQLKAKGVEHNRSGKITLEGVRTAKKEVQRNELMRRTMNQAKTMDFSHIKFDKHADDLQVKASVKPVQNMDFGGLDVDLDHMTPMAFSGKITNNTKKMNLLNARAAANNNPNGAYTIALETFYTDSITAQGEQRWYNLQLAETKKLTVYMASVALATVDNDLALYKLDTATYTLSMVSKSQNQAGVYELLSHVADPGIYYICVTAYACSAPNNFNFLARVSNVWDAEEADDSMALAKEQPIYKIMKRTLDNSIDQDCTIWLVEKTGNYRLEFFDVPENCNYQLQILNANQQLITTISKNTSTNFTNVAPGGYFVRVQAPDGVVEPTSQYGVLISRIPDDLTDLNNYVLWFTDDKNHFVEYVSFPTKNNTNKSIDVIPNIYAVYVNGNPIDVKSLEFTSYRRYSTDYNKSSCTGSSYDDACFIGIYIGSYSSAQAPTVEGIKPHSLMLTIHRGYFSTYHMMRVYDKNAWPSKPDDYIVGTDQFTATYYQGYWHYSVPGIEMGFVFDIDQNGLCVDLFAPNWFYGTHDYYGVGTERPRFVSDHGEGWILNPPYITEEN